MDDNNIGNFNPADVNLLLTNKFFNKAYFEDLNTKIDFQK